MEGDAIFLNVGGDLVLLAETPYATEKVLQLALAEHPEVIAGPTTAEGNGGQLLLVRREMGVPGAPDGPTVWSLDHLFLDRDGVPVVVEVKRSSDTRIRREVVGQMLDYAANGTVYWPVEKLRQLVEVGGPTDGFAGEDAVTSLWPQLDVEEYWRKVQANLEAGRLRMLFVADRIPPELARIIEFLNEQMSPAEVLGVELRQYVAGEHIAYVPRVIGQTTRAKDAKTVGGGGQLWSEESLLAAARELRSTAEVALVERLLADAAKHGRAGWGKGATAGVSGWYHVGGQPTAVWNLNLGTKSPTSRAYMYVYFADLIKRLPPERIERAADILARIPTMTSKITEARENDWKRYPSVYLSDLVTTPASVTALFEALDVLVDEH